MQMALAIAIGGLENVKEEDCPFKTDLQGVTKKDDEDISYDDLDDVQEAQDNDGGKLGSNLNTKSNGDDEFWKDAPFPPPTPGDNSANDSRRKDGKKKSKIWQKVKVPGTTDVNGNTIIAENIFPFTVAAHHLIPGNASLYNNENDLQKYMIMGETVKAGGKSWEIAYHIGYNVNGAHNGVWLPGNYAIRSRSSPTKVTWGSMGHEDWQLNYVAACCKAVDGQFHDAHTNYNDSILSLMNAMAEKLEYHQCHCKECEGKNGKKVPPPYMIKERLYNLSKYFRSNLTVPPNAWRRPWFTSDRWRDNIFKNGATKPCQEFIDAYNNSSVEEV